MSLLHYQITTNFLCSSKFFYLFLPFFLPYPWKFQTRQSFTHGNSTKLCVGSIREIPRPKIKTPAPGNSTSLFFLSHPWKFHLINPWKFHTYAISLIPLEIPYPQPTPLHVFFFWNSLMKQSKLIVSAKLKFIYFTTGTLQKDLAGLQNLI